MYSRFIHIMIHYEGVGGFGGCPTTACVVVGGEKGFPRATFGSGIRGRLKKEALRYRYGELTKEFGVKELKSEPGVATPRRQFHILSISPRMD